MTDIKDLVIKLKNGDAEAFEQLYEKYKNDVYFFAFKLTKNETAAEDVVQDTFLEVFNSINKLEKPESFKSWLFSICHHKCYAKNRKESKEMLLSEDNDFIFDDIADEDTETMPEELLESNAFKEIIENMFDTLPETQREAMILYYYKELSVSQIAEIMECSQGTVKSYLNYGRKKMKACVEKFEKDNNIKLHSFSPALLLVLLFNNHSPSELPFGNISGFISDISSGLGAAATENAINISSTAASAANTVTTSAANATTNVTSAGIWNKIIDGANLMWQNTATRVASLILAGVVVAGGTYVALKSDKNSDGQYVGNQQIGDNKKESSTFSEIDSSEVVYESLLNEETLKEEGPIYKDLNSNCTFEMHAHEYILLPVSYTVPEWMNREPDKIIKSIDNEHKYVVRVWQSEENPEILMCIADYFGIAQEIGNDRSNFKYETETSLTNYIVTETIRGLYPSKDNNEVYPNETAIKDKGEIETSSTDLYENKSKNYQFTNVFYTRPKEFENTDYVYTTGNVVMHYSRYKPLIFGIDTSKNHLYKKTIREVSNNIAKTTKIVFPKNEKDYQSEMRDK